MISIILPIKNEGRRVDITLDSLFNRLRNQSLISEIILVYDGEDQDTSIISDSFSNRIKKVVLKKTLGPAQARNKGAEVARGDYLLFLDAHIYWEEGDLATLFDISKGESIVGANICDIRNPGSYGNVLTLRNFNLEGGWEIARPLLEYVPSVGGAFIFVPKKVFDTLGGFNTYFKGWGLEDIEFGWRANMMGYKILISEVKIAHRFVKSFDYFKIREENVLFNKLVFWYLYLRTTKFSPLVLNTLVGGNLKRLDILNEVLSISKDLKEEFIYKFKVSPNAFLKNNLHYHAFLQNQKSLSLG